MSTVINLFVASQLLGFAFVLLRLCNTRHRGGLRVWDEAAERWVYLPPGVEPGPGQLTEAQVDAFDRFQVELGDLVTDPQWKACRARLLNAIDNEQKGDQA